MNFKDFNFDSALLEGLEAMRFENPTPIQELSIPTILKGKDTIAIAQTGTGKTAAFLLPLLNNLTTKRVEKNKINAIIMSPTRELAQQIDQQLEGFGYFVSVSSVAVYGGNDGGIWEQQKKGLIMGADVVIATPGRLISHLNLYDIDLSGVDYFILDEADRMLDMGFYDDILTIAKKLPEKKQTIMFSATMPQKIRKMAQLLMRNPEEVSVAISKPAEKIVQAVSICHEHQKIPIILSLFKKSCPERAIIFVSSKVKVRELYKRLLQHKIKVGEMHSDLDQAQREQVMRDFKNAHINVLVATDIVARGIDIVDISLVMNYDVPHDCEDYVHRIGRTARADTEGVAITLVSEEDQFRLAAIETFLEKSIYQMPLPDEVGEGPVYDKKRFEGKKKHFSNKNRRFSNNRNKKSSYKGKRNYKHKSEPKKS